MESECSIKYVELHVDSEKAERFKACKRAGFPLCLEKSLTDIFASKDTILSVAAKKGFNLPRISSSHDVWQLYIDLLAALEETLGKDVVTVIEYATLKEMEWLACTSCPLYKLEQNRKEEKYSSALPSGTGFTEV